MINLLWNLANNLAEGIHKIKCKSKHNDKKLKLVELNTKIATAFEYTNFKDDLIWYEVIQIYRFNPYIFSNQDDNKFILLKNGENVFTHIDT